MEGCGIGYYTNCPFPLYGLDLVKPFSFFEKVSETLRVRFKPDESKLRVVALLAVRNEALYMERCLEHLFLQGIETCIIDNESSDATLEIARKFLDRGVFRIVTQAYQGYYDWVGLLQLKEKLCQEIDANWFIHVDADEIREAPAPFKTLYEGIMKADQEGYNAINFDEFVFLPTAEDESFEGTDYVENMRRYYFFEPVPLRQVKAWKNTGQKVDLVSFGGHRANFVGRNIYPQNFILRHYIVLSRTHAIAKYGSERIYSQEEVKNLKWHGARATFSDDKLALPLKHELKILSPNYWDRSQPWAKHTFLGDDGSV